MSRDYVDPDDPTLIDWPSRQARALVPFNVVNSRPVNPVQHLDTEGRGRLRLWGENQAADPVVVTEEAGQRWVLLIDREDGGGWAVPGGRVEPGEQITDTLVRELREETGLNLTGHTPHIVWAGFAHDPRNTDEAWMCTTAAVFRIPEMLPVYPGDDACRAVWFRFNTMAQLEHDLATRVGGVLYQPQPPLLQAALDHLNH